MDVFTSYVVTFLLGAGAVFAIPRLAKIERERYPSVKGYRATTLGPGAMYLLAGIAIWSINQEWNSASALLRWHAFNWLNSFSSFAWVNWFDWLDKGLGQPTRELIIHLIPLFLFMGLGCSILISFRRFVRFKKICRRPSVKESECLEAELRVLKLRLFPVQSLTLQVSLILALLASTSIFRAVVLCAVSVMLNIMVHWMDVEFGEEPASKSRFENERPETLCGIVGSVDNVDSSEDTRLIFMQSREKELVLVTIRSRFFPADLKVGDEIECDGFQKKPDVEESETGPREFEAGTDSGELRSRWN